MKLSSFFYALLVASSAWATNSYVLFADDKGTMRPLVGIFSGLRFIPEDLSTDIKNMAFEVESHSEVPPEFIIEDKRYLVTTNQHTRMNLGFWYESLIIGPEISPQEFEMDRDGKLKFNFYAKLIRDVRDDREKLRISNKHIPGSSPINVYLLPFEKKVGPDGKETIAPLLAEGDKKKV